MKLQAAFLTDFPTSELVRIFGALDTYEDVLITRSFDSEDRLRTLIGTAQARVEQTGQPYIFKAAIIPAGTKPPKRHTKYRVPGLLRRRMDYGSGTGGPADLVEYELRSPYNKFYAKDAATLINPENVIIPPNEWYKEGLKEKDVVEYYNKVSNKIVGQYTQYDLEGMTALKPEDEEKVIFKRNAHVEVLGMKIGDKKAFDQLNTGRMIEFHFALGDSTPFIWVDMDPKEGFPWADTKSIAMELAKGMTDSIDGAETEIRFSGKSGFHIYRILESPIPIDEARGIISKFLDDYIKGKNDDRLTTKVTRDSNTMRLDFSTLHRTGGLRMAYSMAYPTGLICRPVSAGELADFEKSDATIQLAGIKKKSAEDPKVPEIAPELRLTEPEIEEPKPAGPDPKPAQEPMRPPMGMTEEEKDRDAKRALELDMRLWDAIRFLVEDPNRLNSTQMNILIAQYNNRGWSRFMRIVKEVIGQMPDPEKLYKVLDGVFYRVNKGAISFIAVQEKLHDYYQKRDFETTPEPRGEVTEGERQEFVIQEHAAHRAGLHYDFRLAEEGVLKSWAVRNLTSLLDGDKSKVLAIQTEDHPMEYGKFEGTIPEGHYGAGNVNVFDRGTYTTVRKSANTWVIDLDGSRINGRYVLVKGRDPKQWFLQKGKH